MNTTRRGFLGMLVALPAIGRLFPQPGPTAKRQVWPTTSGACACAECRLAKWMEAGARQSLHDVTDHGASLRWCVRDSLSIPAPVRGYRG